MDAMGETVTAGEGGPTFKQALQDQLGLKLDAQKVPTDMLAIDHAEKPSEN